MGDRQTKALVIRLKLGHCGLRAGVCAVGKHTLMVTAVEIYVARGKAGCGFSGSVTPGQSVAAERFAAFNPNIKTYEKKKTVGSLLNGGWFVGVCDFSCMECCYSGLRNGNVSV
ncbi:hypothetical protein MATL_G00091170 [Megalops atlanticus]|uniref:Uncharacterized protein n=1 Tax=Megalops atlanticus TaxID=7932 RepID=A0A9D3Q724_MEGAT|nr:hypothetical protein MATL_G00091170 [Megalops atlanticus]